jgi:hypothetical protein
MHSARLRTAAFAMPYHMAQHRQRAAAVILHAAR